jgi:hypothetical protein
MIGRWRKIEFGRILLQQQDRQTSISPQGKHGFHNHFSLPEVHRFSLRYELEKKMLSDGDRTRKQCLSILVYGNQSGVLQIS